MTRGEDEAGKNIPYPQLCQRRKRATAWIRLSTLSGLQQTSRITKVATIALFHARGWLCPRADQAPYTLVCEVAKYGRGRGRTGLVKRRYTVCEHGSSNLTANRYCRPCAETRAG